MKAKVILAQIVMLAFLLSSNAAPVTIDFEAVPDSTEVGDIYASDGIHFQDAVGLAAGISLNEIDYPPHSGAVAVADDGSPITISFDSPVSDISAWFAFLEPLTFTALNNVGTVIGTYTDPVLSNLGSDLLISLSFSDVSSLEISAPDPSTYVFDDMSFMQSVATAPDDSSTLWLLGTSAVILMVVRCGKRVCRT